MRRLNMVLIPVVALAAAGSSLAAQTTRKAPSIGDAVRRVPVTTSRGTTRATPSASGQGRIVTTRGVNLPEEQRCREERDRRDREDRDRNRRDRDDRDDRYRYDGRYDRNTQQGGTVYGCCLDDRNDRNRNDRDPRISGRTTGRGTIDSRGSSSGRGTGVGSATGRVTQSSNNRNDGCGYYDGNDRDRDDRNDRNNRNDRDFNRWEPYFDRR